MEVILLEKISKLGDLGSVVKVRAGYGRNYLVPQGKALPATKKNLVRFEKERQAFEERQRQVLETAEKLAAAIAEVTVVLERPAGATEKLFGSVTNSDIFTFFEEKGLELPKGVIDVPHPIRTLGEHPIRLRLHPDVIPEVMVHVERQVKK
ncbi:MAG: 50S ribosomal protein L9 [Magnetococcales bacterium]|nr:50S ribosomal protein L9 [Magnetococcales bacterium]